MSSLSFNIARFVFRDHVITRLNDVSAFSFSFVGLFNLR